ncbi:trypsin alpha-3-like [Teleopsis dalmanni]|uniref:trypsin alpha-3-like n=1 Tax=Teleopsis dalmanni TaxID=139649 RepID=UPI0018CF906B|nr:trypsin alpha-3-like [Teleopsis dalmanni]XP_037950282.1 trypsin alpha-3-like [Teleopsis dalmanni]
MWKNLLQLALLLISLANYVNGQAKIVGGSDTPISAAPYTVNIRLKSTGELICCGTLVSSNMVITAATCLKDKYTIDQLTIQGNTNDFSATGTRRNADLLIYPTAFNITTYNFDVCMLRLKTAMPSTLTPAVLGTSGVSAGQALKLYGWGLTSEGGSPSNILQTTTVNAISKAQCLLSYELTETMFCANAPGKDGCDKDSGGPVVNANNQVVGIMSWGYGCGRADYPRVCTSIAKTADWINYCISTYG